MTQSRKLPTSACLTAVTPAEDSEEKRLNHNGEEMEVAMDKEGASKPGAEIRPGVLIKKSERRNLVKGARSGDVKTAP